MTLGELRRKDVICVADGRLVGRVCDLVFDERDGRLRALIVCTGGVFCVFHGEKGQITVPFAQVACIGDDVILISNCSCG